MINLELYRVFYEVADMGNITKASLKLHISQPAVTKHIKNLEDELGGPLFIRTKKGVILNEAGQAMFILVKQALGLIKKAEKKCQALENLEAGTIRIGISTTLTKKYLLPYIKSFHKLYPNIIIEISTDPTSEMIKLMKKGIIDFIIAKIPTGLDNELDYIPLGEQEYVFVINDDYKELLNKKLSLLAIAHYPILLPKQPSNSRQTIDEYCLDNNIKINTIMNIASSNLLIDFAKIGYGIGFTTKQYIENELKNNELFILDIYPKLKKNKFGIIKLKNNILPFSCKNFIDTIIKTDDIK